MKLFFWAVVVGLLNGLIDWLRGYDDLAPLSGPAPAYGHRW